MELTQPTNGTGRKALGRGLSEILGLDVPQTESVNTARAAFEIAAILEGVEDRQVDNIFTFVQDIRRTAVGESVQEIGEGLNRLERERRERDKAPKRGWFGRKTK